MTQKYRELFSQYLPILDWGRKYTRENTVSDVTAAIIVTLMLVPQALAYAMLSGLPPQVAYMPVCCR